MGNTVWDEANRTLFKFKIPNLKNYQPWRNVASGKRTRTANMCVVLHVQEENHSGLIDRKLIAQALQKRNLFRVAEPIQISPNQTILLHSIHDNPDYVNILHRTIDDIRK